jgi:OFA family oxalate/formate antiporter-like MFS transporter
LGSRSAAIIALCYGGGFGTMPAFAADYFGPKFAGSIYGLMLTAWGVGGAFGPILIAQVRDRTGNYRGAMYVIAVVMLIAAAIPLIVRPPRATEGQPATMRAAAARQPTT